MANFEIALDITLAHEGLYSNDSLDVGGETLKGISRKYNLYWGGWAYVDEIKARHSDLYREFFIELESNDHLTEYVTSFYREKYWDRFLGDRIDNQLVANELFDTSVNMGVGRACVFFQQALNYLNRNGNLFSDLVEDGLIGYETMRSFECIVIKDIPILLKITNVLQGMHYLNYMKKSPTQERFARGWFNRVSISK